MDWGEYSPRPVFSQVAEVELPSKIRVWTITTHLSPHRFGKVIQQGISIFKHCQDLSEVSPKQLAKVNELLKSLKGKNVNSGGDCNGLPQGIDFDRLSEGYTDCFAAKGRGFGITGISNRID